MSYLSEPIGVLGQPLRLRFDPLVGAARCDRLDAFPFARQFPCDSYGKRSSRVTGIDARSPVFQRQSRSRVKLILLGDPDGVDQNVIELERRGYCDSDAWTPPLIVRENAPPIQPLPGELMRLYQRWYPATGQRQIPF